MQKHEHEPQVTSPRDGLLTFSNDYLPKPSGRRRVTTAMARAQIFNELMPMASASRGQIIVAFKRGARVLGVPKPIVEFVLYLASRTKAVDWQEDGKPLAHPSNRDLEVELLVGRSRIKTLIRQAAEWGLLVCADSPTGRRYARRDQVTGHIAYGYGFDLSPLSRRHDEFQAAIAAQQEREREGARLRRHIMVQRNAILSLAECADAEGVTCSMLTAFANEAAGLGRMRGDDWNPTRLSPLAARLDELLELTQQRLSVLLPVESDPTGGPKVAPITTTNPSTSAYASTDAEGRSASSAQEMSRSSIALPTAFSSSFKDCPLRGFQASPALILQIAPAFRDLCPSSRPTQAQIVDAAGMVAGNLGISHHAWGQACHVLGRYAAAVTVAIIAAKRDQGQVGSPGGYLRKITANHQAGDLHLDKTLFGLVDALGVRGRA